jgi:hypothetical protein
MVPSPPRSSAPSCALSAKTPLRLSSRCVCVCVVCLCYRILFHHHTPPSSHVLLASISIRTHMPPRVWMGPRVVVRKGRFPFLPLLLHRSYSLSSPLPLLACSEKMVECFGGCFIKDNNTTTLPRLLGWGSLVADQRCLASALALLCAGHDQRGRL